MKKFLIKCMLITVLYVALACHATVFATYEDISGHWAEETITKFVEKDYLNSGDSFFEPDLEITKGELATIVNRYFAYGLAVSQEDNLRIAEENGYLVNSEVAEKITREEVAILLCKTLSLTPIEEKSSFADDDIISVWAKGYVVALEKKDIMIGYPNHVYQPHKNITKAEFVTALNRCIGVGGADLEILNAKIDKLEIGTLETGNGKIKFVPIEDKVELKLGDSLTLALKVPEGVEEEKIKFEISNEEVIDFEKKLYIITALKYGMTEVKLQILDEIISFQVVVE